MLTFETFVAIALSMTYGFILAAMAILAIAVLTGMIAGFVKVINDFKQL